MTLRSYQPDDLARCMEIVDEAWAFSDRVRPPALAEFALRLYTAGSLAQSRYASVVEEADGVEAFLFGRAGSGDRFRTEFSGPVGRLRPLRRLLGIRGLGLGDKFGWLRDITRHEIARARVQPVGDGEVTLFAAAKAARGKGHGRRLMDDYAEHCRRLGIDRLTLETDVESSYGFYDHYGFTVVGEFTSPMNQRFSGGSGRAFVYELRL